MSNINSGRVLLGGLLAGVILNIGETVLNVVVLGPQMRVLSVQHNFPPDPPPTAIACAVGMTFVMGIVLVLGYACIRTRLGPSVKTAIIAGLFAWFGVYCYAGMINGVFFGLPVSTMILQLVWGLVQYSLAAIAGAWLYKES